MTSYSRMAGAVVAALLVALSVPPVQAAGAPSARSTPGRHRWSDPAAWDDSAPVAGSRVTIEHGSTVVLDTSTPSLGGLQVDGKLVFKDKDLDLTADWVMVHGLLRAGRHEDRFQSRAVITLTGSGGEDVMGTGTKFLGVMGGALELHGRPATSWTRLGATAEPGTDELVLEAEPNWRPGDSIVVASTDYWAKHAEERTVTHVSGTTVGLDEPLDYQHWGVMQTIGGRTLDERAEVGLLSHNIVVRGDQSSSQDGFGGHTMIMEGGEARIEGVEFERMGQRLLLRKYPVHFHMDGDAPTSYLRNSAIHHSFNRCVTVHGTNKLRVTKNVCYDHVGHGFFLEDGAETDNRFIGNLGLRTREIEDGLLPTDRRPATFWITNPDNVVRGNVAAGSDAFGFWYALPKHPTGLSEQDDIWPRRAPLGEFRDNVAHSNGDRGLNVDEGPRPDGTTESAYYAPVSDPSDPDSEPVTARFENFTGYMNRDRAVWLRGENHVVDNAVLADNRSGATFASAESFLDNSFVVGESANKGTPEEWEDTGPGGRALPFFWEPETPIVGFEFYDGRVGVRSTTFANFNDNSLRPSGALGYLTPDAFSIDPNNFSAGVTLVDSEPVYLADPEPGMDGDASKVFVDSDGSLTGTAGRAVVVNNPFLLPNGCDYRAEWNAHVCDADYVSLWIGTNDSAAVKPVTLARRDGTTQTLMGCCDESEEAITTVLSNRSYDLSFTGGTPSDLYLVLWRGKGRWLQLSLEVSGPVDVTRWGHALDSVSSKGALDDAGDSAYYYDSAAGNLHVKLDAQYGNWEEVRVRS